MRTDKWIFDVERYAKNAGRFKVQDLIVSMKQAGYSVSRATVYRAVNKLSKVGKILQVSDGKERYFEFVQEKVCYHFRCKRCGKLFEFFFDDIERIIQETSRKLEIFLIEQKLVLEGYCSRCYRNKKR